MLWLLIVFSLLAATSASGCSLESTAQLIYLEYSTNNSAPFFHPREEQPQIVTSSCSTVENTAECCVCNSYYICSRLDDALKLIVNENVSHLYMSLGDANWMLNDLYSLNKFTSLVIQGFGRARITCTANGAGLQVDSSYQMYMQNILISNCCGHSSIMMSRTGAAVTLRNTVNLNLTDVTFWENPGTGLMIGIDGSHYMSFDCPQCDLTHTHYTINNSEFIRNGNNTQYGGGIYIIVQAPYHSTVLIANSRFISNRADIGGGIYYEAESLTRTVLVPCPLVNLNIKQTLFFENFAKNHGGAMYYTGLSAAFEGVKFIRNTAQYTAGGVYQFIDNVPSYIVPILSNCISRRSVTYRNCEWLNNIAAGSGAFLLISPSNISASRVHVEDCIFKNNSVSQNFFSGQSACVIFAQNVPLYFTNVTISYSNGTALCIQSTLVFFNGTNAFISNSGYYGGGVYIDHANLFLESDSNVTFSLNNAVFGGGIYQNSLTMDSCIFLFASYDDTTAFVHFDNNNAISKGRAIYFQNPNINCEMEINSQQVNFLPNHENQFSSAAFSIVFHGPINENNTMVLILGQKIVFNATIQDYFNQTSYAQINLFLRSRTDNTLYDHNLYSLDGFRQFSIATGPNYPNIFIKGPRVNGTNNQYTLNVESIHTSKQINLVLMDCPLGYYYSETTQSCKCVNISDAIVKCNDDDGTACIAVGYWLGVVDRKYTVSTCSSGFCHSSNDNCSLCSILDTDDDYCLLPHTTSGQCIDNRDGRLCAYCEEGYAFTFGSAKCVKDTTCAQGQGIVTPLLNVFFLIITFVVIILLLKFDYKLSSGYIFCFVYYFSIVGHLFPPNLVGDILFGIISLFESVTQLNPKFLGFIPICFSNILTALEQQVFLYVNPLIISIFVLTVIGLSKYCSKYISFNDNTLIKAICLLLLLSFTALAETSLNLLNGVSFENSGQVYVTIQPATRYFNLKEHVPCFVIGLLVVCALVIPFTLLLLLAPMLARCFNMNKIKPFLDEFQGCYKDKFRWMAGYYFLCRFVYFFILAIPSPNLTVLVYIVQLLSFTVLVIHMLIQPYESSWLNFSDSLLLADLTLISLLFGETGNVVFGRDSPVRLFIVYVLVFIPVLYLVIILAVTAAKRCNTKEKLKNQRRPKSKRTGPLLEPLFSPTKSPTKVMVDYRDPVLGLIESQDDARYTITRSPSTVRYSVLDSPSSYRNSDKTLVTVRTTSQSWQDDDELITNERDDL